MTEQPDDSPRRVVKKVVKKTVVRPVSSGALHPAGASGGRPDSAPPRQPPARLTTPARAQAARTVTPSITPPKPTVSPAAPVPAPKPAIAPVVPATQGHRPQSPALSFPKPRLRGWASGFGDAVGDGVRGVLDGLRHRVEDGWDWLVSLRLPHLSPVRGSAITGVVVGLLSVLIGWGFYEVFSATLGTRAGGGWGFLAFVFLSFVAFVVGELLLTGFGVPHARVVSILSVLLVLLSVLLFFIKLAAGVWAWLLIPVLAALAFVGSSVVMSAAAKEQNPQRLPWEPVDESQVNRN